MSYKNVIDKYEKIYSKNIFDDNFIENKNIVLDNSKYIYLFLFVLFILLIIGVIYLYKNYKK